MSLKKALVYSLLLAYCFTVFTFAVTKEYSPSSLKNIIEGKASAPWNHRIGFSLICQSLMTIFHIELKKAEFFSYYLAFLFLFLTILLTKLPFIVTNLERMLVVLFSGLFIVLGWKLNYTPFNTMLIRYPTDILVPAFFLLILNQIIKVQLEQAKDTFSFFILAALLFVSIFFKETVCLFYILIIIHILRRYLTKNQIISFIGVGIGGGILACQFLHPLILNKLFHNNLSFNLNNIICFGSLSHFQSLTLLIGGIWIGVILWWKNPALFKAPEALFIKETLNLFFLSFIPFLLFGVLGEVRIWSDFLALFGFVIVLQLRDSE